MEAHEILGVPEDASEDVIRAAYKALALKWHPDRRPQNGEQATTKFIEINKAHRTMLRTLARARRTTKATQDCPNSDHLPPSPPASESLFASLKQPSRSTRSRKTSSPASSCSLSSSISHSSQPSRSSSQTREETPLEDTPCASTSSINSAPIPPSDSFINPKGPAPQTDTLPEKSNDQSNTCNSNSKIFHHHLAESLACDPDFMGDTLRPERLILRPKKSVHVLNMTLEEIPGRNCAAWKSGW